MADQRAPLALCLSLVLFSLLCLVGGGRPSQGRGRQMQNLHGLRMAGQTRRTTSEGVESKVERLGQVFRRNVRLLRERADRLDLVFLVDESSSVGAANFRSELHFVRKMLSDFPVAPEATRVALVTFSSKSRVVTRVDHVSAFKQHQHKCSLFNKEIPGITYQGGGTYTRGAFQRAAHILRHSRENSTKVIFLITDGYSNGGDPRPVAAVLRQNGVEIFTLGIWQGNIRELHDMASHPKDQHCYLVHNFAEFEALARRALHEDLPTGTYIQEDMSHCSSLCAEGRDCCDLMASCKCGTHTGQYDCVCEKGHYGKGLQHECTACPSGTYKPEAVPGGVGTCQSCPDPQHTSRPGSTALSDCVCKDGYRLHNHTCQAVVCSVLSPPEHGFFIQSVCNNQYNSACGVRCLPGFELQRSSIRLCQANGTWSGAPPICTARSCPVLSPPPHGKLNCSEGGSPYRLECAVHCQQGYRIEGQAKLTCLSSSQWSSPPPRCVEVRCPRIVTFKHVRLMPPVCGERAVRSGAICRLSCRHGYRLMGNPEVRCLPSGDWNNDLHKATCADAEPPWIECPGNIIMETDKHQGSSNITLGAPILGDNSGEEVSVQVMPVLNPTQPFPIGTELITYTATDHAGNQANCSFTVTVIDTEPPLIDRCRSPPTVQATDRETPVYWEEPQFSDNSGAWLNISSTHSSGDAFPIGETAVYYTATDPSGNNRTCELIITVEGSTCEQPYIPVNADFSCLKREKGVNCTLVCRQGYSLTQNAVHSYFCPNNGLWEPARSTDRPECSLNRIANNGFKPFEMLFKASRCDDPDLLKSFTGNFNSVLGGIVPNICSGDDISCKLEVMSQGQCLEYNYDYPNGFAIGPGGWGSNGQDYAYFDSGFSLDHHHTPLQQDGVFHHNSHIRAKRNRGNNRPTRDQKIQIYFNITASIPLPMSRNDSMEVANQKRLLRTLELLTNRLKRTLSRQPLSTFHVSSEMIVADPKSLESKKASLFCQPGSVLKGRMCVQCPVGTYFSVEHAECESCRRGAYQDEEGQLECKRCPDGSSTPYLHSRSLVECRAQCKPGSSSLSGLETCESCPLGEYQPGSGSRFCLPCPPGTSTVIRGAMDPGECGVPCVAGHFSRTGLVPCYPCPRDYYQPNEGRSYCLSCPFYGTTTITGARSIQQCSSFGSSFLPKEESVTTAPEVMVGKDYQASSQMFHECFLNPCQNQGTCEEVGVGFVCTCLAGFTGAKCENDIDECDSAPCQNSGLCRDGMGGFQCQCQPGFVGLLCEVEINECSSSPCLNEGVCVDKVNRFTCSCTDGFTGPQCELEVDECESSPCQNRGVCKDQQAGYSCSCSQGFTGDNCEVNIDECYSAPCLNKGTCVDAINDFRCECVKGYSGKLCQVDEDECKPNPCENSATCEDGVGIYTCRCPPGFNGTRCETEMSSSFDLEFEVSGIHSYVMMDGLMPSLDQITCAFWMRSSDTVNYGTPISYAVEGGSDNSFLLIDYNGWVLYVNGREKITDCPAVNDGRWHHIAVSWRSKDGDWRVYIDGSPSDGGKDLSVGTTIPGGGALVLGQDQDQRGEGFNPVESFVGSLSQLNIWNYVLSPQQIRSLATSCPSDLQKGNVFAWPDFLHGVTGRVKINPKSMFCADCPLLEGTVPNLLSSSPAVSPGSQVKFSCNPGYYLVGEPVMQCQNRGAWSHTQPRCQRTNCGAPPPLEYGQYQGEDFDAGSSVIYQCKPGFYLLGESKMQCSNSGKWSGSLPACLDVDECALGSDCDENASCQNTDGSYICTCFFPYTGDGKTCTALSCSPPTVPEHAILMGTNFTYRSKVTFSCDKGYILQGPMEIQCQSSLTWNRPPPGCQPVTCGEPPVVDHAEFTLSGKVYLSTLSYTCMEGYRLQGPRQLKCEQFGEWTSPLPVCVKLNCGEPPHLKDAVIKGDNFTLGSQVHYICKEGYTLLGAETQECLPSGEWSHNSAQCVPRSCGPPPPVDHALPDTGHQLFGDTAIYFCDDGYTTGNNTKLFCNAEGIWAPPDGLSMPHCIANFCQRPPDLPHAILDSINKSKYASNTEVSYKCEEGFVLNTTATLKCLMGGDWSPSPMDIGCVPVRCSKPETIERGYVSGTNYSFGAVVAYSCDKGYYIRGEKRRTCKANGEWGGVLPTCQPIACSSPPRLTNGYIKESMRKGNYVYSNKVTYACNAGYRLTGKPERMCMANKQWSNSDPPVCVLLTCPTPSTIEHGHYSGSIFEVGSKVEYVCDEGYELTGDAVWTCLKYGKWDKSRTPHCSPVKCPEPPLEENHLVLRSLDSDSGTVELSCEDGYVLYGARTLRCTPSQEWNDSFPVCKQVSCGPPPEVSFGDPSSASSYFSSVVTYSCMAGFTLRKESSVSCQADGHWSTPHPECIPVECPHPEEIPNGIVDVQGLMYLSTALYSCKPGYDLVGNSTVLCGQSGLWIGGVPACRPIECPPPKEIRFGSAKYSKLQFSRSVTYFCQRGYRLEGPETLICLESGKWDKEAPSCIQVYCLPPKSIDSGFVEGQDHKFGATIFYSCFPGFLLVGENHLTCEEHGWSSSVPICIPADCGLPPHIDFGDYLKIQDPSAELSREDSKSTGQPLLADNSYLHGTMVQYHCHAGYEMSSGVALLCQENGTWNGTAPVCVPAECETPPYPEHGSAIVKDTALGSLVEYSCEEGYELDSHSVRQCISGRQWSDEAPNCVPVKCGDPGGIANGEVVGVSFHFSDVIHYECHSGFILQGLENRTCLMDGKWDGKAPWCKAVSCGRPVVSSSVLVKGDDYTFGKRVLFQCNPGFLLHGAPTSVCLANGTWSESAPKCLPADCGAPPIVKNSRVSGTNYGYNGKVNYECDVGYTLTGNPTLVCRGDGLWDDPPPRCDIVTCDPPEDISHGFLNGSSFNFEDVVEYVCFPGYEVVGSPILRCAAEGIWLGEVPECRPCVCNPPKLKYGVVLGRDHTCGASIWFRCDEGYKTLGPTEAVCDKGGVWSPGVPICSKGRCSTPPPTVPNAVVIGSATMFDTVTYGCRPGYHIQGPPNVSCGRLGRWGVPNLHCDPVSCGMPPLVPNAEIVESTFTYGSKAQYRCLDGYKMATQTDSVKCQSDGTWSKHSVRCRPIPCSLPSNITNVIVTGAQLTPIGGTVTISCRSGFYLEGPGLSECELFGRWSPFFSSNSCVPVICEKPLPLLHGNIKGERYSYGDMIMYTCLPGFQLQGDSVHICQGDSTWSGAQPLCVAKSCGPPPFVQNAVSMSSGESYQSNVTYVCKSGRKLIGPQNLTCQVNGTWSLPAPTCEAPESCVKSDKLLNGMVQEHSLANGSALEFFCDKGYTLQGESLVLCMGNGSWSSSFPVCTPKSCPSPPGRTVNRLNTTFLVGQTILVTCPKGQQVKGQRGKSTATITCRRDQTWSPITSVCETVCWLQCQNGGVCQRPNICSCPEGWMGRLCEEPICILPCLNGGRCVAPYQCECPAGWTGTRCHTAVCSTPCLNGGRCIRPNRCQCSQGWGGHDCSRKRKSGYFHF
ncbi:sushi, von Willebrand factor type A, EGF and pentraxin domain-containing protein 1 isoform X3 [Electrophorus electricus]|uniref:sushi, von Willebrand factor type A, EGF and pentraxin domain-containing protein 1 isoform X3 n=1 Tax=Electrophorus electricus TaxID=8005 RepID=UPI0015CF8E26|nr:sushi, von Willebrand factor type A, EGF and pentraxin domain-containing protein 1 isoform X3 [Electrophorus electricus]